MDYRGGAKTLSKDCHTNPQRQRGFSPKFSAGASGSHGKPHTSYSLAASEDCLVRRRGEPGNPEPSRRLFLLFPRRVVDMDCDALIRVSSFSKQQGTKIMSLTRTIARLLILLCILVLASPALLRAEEIIDWTQAPLWPRKWTLRRTTPPTLIITAFNSSALHPVSSAIPLA